MVVSGEGVEGNRRMGTYLHSNHQVLDGLNEIRSEEIGVLTPPWPHGYAFRGIYHISASFIAVHQITTGLEGAVCSCVSRL